MAVYQLEDGHAPPGEVDYRPGHVLPGDAQLGVAASLGATRVNWNRFGTVHSMVRHGGYLAAGYEGTPVQAARAFIRDYRALFRLSAAAVDELELVNDGATPGNAGHAVLFRQQFAGLPAAHDGLITVGVVDGKVYYVSSSSAGDQPPPGPASLTPTRAWLAAAADVNRFVTPAGVLSANDLTATQGWHLLDVAGFSHPQRARLVAMPLPEGGVRQAWETIVLDVRGGAVMAYVHFVDAGTGDILRREDRVNYQAGGTTNTPFSGTMPPDGSCAPRHDFEVGTGYSTLAASVAMDNPINDIYLNMYYVDPVAGPVIVATFDSGFSPEAVTYEPAGGVPAGTYQVEVCMYQQAEPLPPEGYNGVFTATEGGTETFPFPPQWSWFGSTPALVFDPATDVRIHGCWVATPGAPGCYVLENLAARAPWDVAIATGKPTNTTTGNQAKSATSWGSPLTPSEPYQPVSEERFYVYPFDNVWNSSGDNGLGCDPSRIRPGDIDVDAAVTNMFVSHNRMHDWSYFLGFTERNYNLQVSNFGLTQPSRENDPENGNVQAGALDGGYPGFQGRNNANQITLQDGVPGITNQYLWMPMGGLLYAPCADGNFDMLIIGHEYTHAISNRMVGGPDSNLGGTHGPAMGEAWSDLAAVEYQLEYGFVQPGYDPTAMATYVLGSPTKGLRNYALSSNPMNFSNYGYDISGPQSHADSEIWGATQWRIRQALVEKYNAQFPESDAQRQKDCADGKYFAEACPGNRRWIQLVFDAFLLMPAAPSMLDARDAMLAADVARFGGANQFELWHAFASSGMGEFAYAASGTDTAPTPNFESPLAEEAELTVVAVASDEGNAPITNARLYVGQYAVRSRHLADTDPATVVDTSSEGARRRTQNNADTFKIAPGTYDLILEAPGYGQHRFTRTLAAGTNTLTLPMRTNRASKVNGALVVTSARHAPNIAAKDNVIDDSENTRTFIGDRPLLARDAPADPSDDGLVEGAHATVDLAGGRFNVTRVHVSTMGGPGDNPSRFGALRKFEIRACDGVCANPLTDFTTVAFTSADDAFPSGAPRPLAPDMTMRTFEFPAVTASHIQLRVLTNQCTGNPRFHGELDDDPANPTDCPTLDPPPIVDPLSQTVTSRVSPRTVVRLTEFQVFGTPVPNNEPVVDAGQGFDMDEGTTRGLEGFASDLDGDTLTLSWEQETGPDVIDFTGTDTLTPTFTAPQVDVTTPLTFRLTVYDGVVSVSDTVVVTVHDLATTTPPATSTPEIGNNAVGGLPPAFLLALGLLALCRRRAP